MFSTTTIASSTKSPKVKISAKRVTLFRVYPVKRSTKRVRARVDGIARETTRASFIPRVIPINMTTAKIATPRWNISSLNLSSAVLP